MKTAVLKIGPVDLHWYGLIFALALLVGLAVALLMARLRRERVDPLAAIMLLGLLTGLLGARMCYVVFNRDFYAPDPARVFAIWEGGLALQGGIVGAIVATLIYTWSSELSFWTWADICAPGLILGQAIGRVGDLVNNQAFGMPTSGSLYVVIPPENRPAAYIDVSHFQPTAAYEGAWDVAVFLLLLGLSLIQRRGMRTLPSGVVFIGYLILYSVGRIVIEGMRIDSLYAGNVRVAQLAGIIFIAVGALLYVLRMTQRDDAQFEAPVIVHGQPSEAYLFAASRAAQPRFSGGTTGKLTDPAQPGSTGRLPELPYTPPGGSAQSGETA